MASAKSKASSILISSSLVFLVVCYLQSLVVDQSQYTLIDKRDYDADVLIIGGSHAGLSGALTLVRHQHDIIIFDDGTPRNRWDTPIHALPSWEHRNPTELLKYSRQELRKFGLVSFIEERIIRVQKENDSLFHVTSSTGKQWFGRKLMIAAGVEFVYPDIPGYADNFPDRM